MVVNATTQLLIMLKHYILQLVCWMGQSDDDNEDLGYWSLSDSTVKKKFNFHIVGFYDVKLMSGCHISIRIWCYHFLFGCKLAYFKMTSLSEMAVLDIYPELKVCFQLHRGGCLFTWLGPRCASYSSAKCALNFLSNLHACSLILKNS